MREYIDSDRVFQPEMTATNIDFDKPHLLIDAVNQLMPFGKYKGLKLIDVPEFYFVWFKKRGFPKGKLGQQMALIYEIKLNRLENVIKPLIKPDDE